MEEKSAQPSIQEWNAWSVQFIWMNRLKQYRSHWSELTWMTHMQKQCDKLNFNLSVKYWEMHISERKKQSGAVKVVWPWFHPATDDLSEDALLHSQVSSRKYEPEPLKIDSKEEHVWFIVFSHLKCFAFLGQQSLDVCCNFLYDFSRVISDQTELSSLLTVDLKQHQRILLIIYIHYYCSKQYIFS